MVNNAVIQAMVQMCRKYVSKGTDLQPYHILWGYAKLLSMDENTLRLMFDKKDSSDELEKIRHFFEAKNLDPKHIRTCMPLLIPDLDKLPGNSGCTDLMKRIFEGGEEITSDALLEQIFDENDAVYQVFHTGKELTDVLEYAKILKEKQRQNGNASGKAEETTSEKAPAVAASGKEAGKEGKAEKPDFLAMSESFRKLRIDLLNEVRGQNDPVMEFVQGCYQGSVLRDSGKRKLPQATFLFVGPPGVGKTLLAQTAAESLGYPCKMFNMSEYSGHQSHEGLIGISSFYDKSEEGVLVKFVRENPKCILIFDEIEKAHRNVIQLFLQILDLGNLDNTYMKCKTEFKDTIIIFTSNACSSIYSNHTGNISRTPKNVILEALKNEKDPNTGQEKFPGAICSRIAAGNLIMFNHLGVRQMSQMVSANFEKTADQIREDYGYQVSFDTKLPLLFLFSRGGSMDARIASRQSDKFIKNELFEISRQLESHQELLNGVETLHFEIDLESEDVDPELKGLFVNSQMTELIVVCRKEDRGRFVLPEDFRVHFADSPAECREYLKEDIRLILIDPLTGKAEDERHGISLDDRNTVGVQIFKMLEQEGCEVPAYLLELQEPLMVTDKDTFLNNGAMGVISGIDAPDASVSRQIQQVAEDLFMEAQGREFGRRGYVLSFNTAQIPEASMLKIQYYDLKKQQAMDAESAAAFVSDVDRPTVRFEDVIGAENAKEELKYFIRYLSNPRKFIREGGKPAKGVLLYGPPGTGKTMLARAMAGESSVAFIQISATEFMTKWFGQSEQNVRDLFRRAKTYAPAIIFIDEIDAIGKTRTGEDPHTESVLNTLLTEIDGFKTDLKKPVFVLAATNYQVEGNGSGRMTLDPALVRRFDNRICVDLPNEKERMQYLKLALGKKGFVDVDEATIKNVATRTPGLSIAILQNVVDLAFRNAGKQNRLPNGNDLQNALEEYNYGEKKDWGAEYYRSVAIHECGHAYLAWKSGEKPSYMTIESRGDFGGYMAHENSEGKPNYTRQDLIWRIRCALGGRAAEEVFFGKEAALNTGASSDLQTATRLAISMICDYGMMEGQFIALPFNTIVNTSLAGAYLEKANQLLIEEMQVTKTMLLEGKDAVERLADRLVEENHLTGDTILQILNKSEF